MSELALISKLISQARRRLLWNEILAELIFSLSVALAGATLILLLGTQLLDWYWLAFLLVGSIGVGVYRIRRRIPSPYVAAQILDRRAGLHDSVSTALFFTCAPQERRDSSDMREAQLRHTASLAERVVLNAVLPFTIPRTTYAMVALALLASSLFALRYGLERKIDLRPPLARIVLDTFGLSFEQRAENRKKQRQGKPVDLGQNLGLSLEDKNSNTPGQLDSAPGVSTDNGDIPDVNNIQKPGPEHANSKTKGKSPGSQLTEGDQSGDKAGNAEQSSGSEAANEGQKGDQRGEKSAGGQGSSSEGENSSLMARLRGAMSNLLSRMRQQPANGNSQVASLKGQAGQQSGKQASAGQNGSPGAGRQQSASDQAGQPQEGQQGGDSEDAQNAEGRGSGKGSEQDSTRAAGSGIGRQDGNKEAKLAEQLAAMGKISEIIGKRSQNVSGEVTIEVRSGKQQLHTPYSHTDASHSEGGGEINRDEVPVLYQQYVRQYFEQVRKNDTAPKAR